MEVTLIMKTIKDKVSTVCGHLKVETQFKNGKKECVFDEDNIIVSGTGLALANLFSSKENGIIDNFKIDRFQVGVGYDSDKVVDTSTTSLFDPLLDEYGITENKIVSDQLVEEKKLLNQYFLKIKKSQIKRTSPTSVTFKLILGDNLCNKITRDEKPAFINEIGLFIKDPNNENSSVLAAYRSFTGVRKTNDFSLIFTWTINFITAVEQPKLTGTFNGTHTFDLSYRLTQPISTMLFMNWLGIPETDNINGSVSGGGDPLVDATSSALGSDQGYGGWKLSTYKSEVYPYLDPDTLEVTGSNPPYTDASSFTNADPSTCSNYFDQMSTTDTCSVRNVWSYLRPANGIYSCSMRTQESIDRFELFTRLLKSKSGKNYGFDAISPVIKYLRWTSYYSTEPDQIRTIPEIRYHAFLNQVQYCEDNGLTNCILPHFETVNLYTDTQTTSLYTTEEIDELVKEEFIFVINRLKYSSAAFRINGRLVLRFFGSSPDGTAFRIPAIGETWDDVNADLTQFFNDVRAATNQDFYTVRTGGNINVLGSYDSVQRFPSSEDYKDQLTQFGGSYDFTNPTAYYEFLTNDSALNTLATDVNDGSFPGRMGGLIVPCGFHDITKQFGAGTVREIPRQPETIIASFSAADYFKNTLSKPLDFGFHALSWDDVAEGHCYWPTVSGEGPTTYNAYNIGPSGTWALDTFDEEFKKYKGETYDPELTCPSSIFLNYGVVRECP